MGVTGEASDWQAGVSTGCCDTVVILLSVQFSDNVAVCSHVCRTSWLWVATAGTVQTRFDLVSYS